MTAANPNNSANKEYKKRGILLQDISNYDRWKNARQQEESKSHICKNSIITEEFPS